MKKLDLVISLKRGKSKEFKQTWQELYKVVQGYSSNIIISELEKSICFSIVFHWESAAEMQQALRTEEFAILSGAINSLCEKTIIRLDDILIGNHISGLKHLQE
jgi:hypothetical protein